MLLDLFLLDCWFDLYLCCFGFLLLILHRLCLYIQHCLLRHLAVGLLLLQVCCSFDGLLTLGLR